MEFPERLNAAEFFVDRNLESGRGSQTAIRYGDAQQTYGELAELVRRASNALCECGVGPGDRVFILLYDSPAFVAAFWGAIRMGAIAVPVNTYLTADDCAFLLGDSGARAVAVEASLLEKITPALAARREPPALLVSGAMGSESGALPTPAGQGVADFGTLLARSANEAEAAPTRRDDPAFWLYTSGSTGRPKAAIHRHRHMVCCFENYARQVLAITSQDRSFSASKLFFAYGLGNGLYFPAGAGAETVLLPERATAERVLEVLERYRPTLFYAVPSLYAALLALPQAEPALWSSVRSAVSAGEALPAGLWHRFRERFGVEILDGIGSTEMLHMFIANRPGRVVPGSSGELVPGYAARLVDDEGREVEPGEMGNLWIRGESAAAGYWNQPALSRETFGGEWTLTGDKYRRDERGYFWHCGRSDDMMKVHGLWVSPVEIESALLACPAVVECAVVAGKDEQGLTQPKAFVVLKSTPSPPVGLDELHRFLEQRLPRHKLPRWLVPTESLPKTATGKIQRFKLRQL